MSTAPLKVRSRGFRAFVVTQFLGAFNDNAFRFTLLSLIAYSATDDAQKGDWAFIAQTVFALPFIGLAAFAGAVADRHRKSTVMVASKAAEIGVMVLGMAAFATGGMVAPFAVLFLMSVQSTMFGPGKYGYLGESMAESELSAANGWISLTTVLAIIAGAVVGPWVFEVFRDQLAWGAALFVVVAVIGWLASKGIEPFERTHDRAPLAFNPLPQMRETWAGVLANRTLLYALGGVVHFYLLGATLQFELLTFAQDVLHFEPALAGTLLAASAVGIAVGSLLAMRWSGGHIELGLVPLGATAMSLGIISLGLVGASLPDGWVLVGAAYAVVFGIGVAAGLFIVPVQATMQHGAPAGSKGRYLAFMNAMSFAGILMAGVVLWIPRQLGLDAPTRALFVGVLSLVGAIGALRILPLAFARFVAWGLAQTFWRVRVAHAERLPTTGGALIIANHVSWVDWLILIGTTRRNMHFLIQREYFEWWTVSWLFRLAGCIPVAAGDPKEKLQASLSAAGEAVEQGRLVVIFAEGSVTRTGNMLSVRSGYRRLLAGRDVPIIPAHIDGLWGSIFSHAGGRLLWKLPRVLAHPVTVTYGESLPADAPPHVVRAALQELSTVAWKGRKAYLHAPHLRCAIESRREWRRTLREDGGRRLSRGRLLAEALVLRDDLPDEAVGAPRVALLADPSVAGARAVLALAFAGSVPVMLDPGQSDEVLVPLLRRLNIQTILATGAHAGRMPGAGVIDLDARLAALPEAAIGRWRRRLFWMRDRSVVRRLVGTEPLDMNAPAAVLFSSGAADIPKAVVLSHFAVRTNVLGLLEVLDPTGDDRLLATLPLSTAFGLTVGLWMPLLSDVDVVWHGRPDDGRDIGRAVQRHGVTLLMAAPRHLARWLDGARPSRLGGVRYALAVGGKLLPALRRSFREHFGIEPVECYSAAECAALIAVNTPDVREMGVFQQGTKAGTVGHPLPGVTVEALDPQTGALLPAGTEGVLRVRGPSLMSGYLDDAERTAAVLREEGYVSGDLGAVDRDGFVTLTGRRCDIAGTPVPLQAVEQAILEEVGATDAPAAVLASPDRRGRPRLVVAYEEGRLTPKVIVKALKVRGLSSAWIPAASDFVAVERLPLTRSGLVDFQALRATIARPY